jgi:hypothetical protein
MHDVDPVVLQVPAHVAGKELQARSAAAYAAEMQEYSTVHMLGEQYTGQAQIKPKEQTNSPQSSRSKYIAIT